MAKKRRKPRTRPANPSGTGPPAASPVRKERKELARQQQEKERKRKARAATGRRTIIFSLVGLVLIGYIYWRGRAPAPRPIPQAAVTAAKAAGCSTVNKKVVQDPVRGHLAAGQTTTYSQRPPTSGIHNPVPLPTSPAVYTAPVDETAAVHFLEHAGVILYYRQTGKDALPDDVVSALAGVANAQRNTLLIPFTDLPTGTSLALTAWNTLQTCPGTVTASQATTIANGFADAFVCTTVGPEPKTSPDC